jgi:hypothetical protein
MEEMRRGQIQDLQDQIAQNQRGTLEWENRFKELRGDIQTLMQRQNQAESVAKQAYALVTQETAQIRGGLKADLAAIEAQLNERRARDAALQGMEGTLNLRLRELHSQLAQGSLAQDHRDGELRDLKSKCSSWRNSSVKSVRWRRRHIEPARSATADPAVATSAISCLGCNQPVATSRSGGRCGPCRIYFSHSPVGPHQIRQDFGNGLRPFVHEIERKRAELREKSGRWKVRQQ